MTPSTAAECLARREARSAAVRAALSDSPLVTWVVVETGPPDPLAGDDETPGPDTTTAAYGGAVPAAEVCADLGSRLVTDDNVCGWFEAVAPANEYGRVIVTWGSDGVLSPADVSRKNAEMERVRRREAAQLGHRRRVAVRLFD
ncbi:hypothetical protein [Crossiella sp. CA198]|uniref:hypothetical protein n=1 Tax=Crossiella sp. CA198 TaxID=3455607 RepID=UPI003F8D37C5